MQRILPAITALLVVAAALFAGCATTPPPVTPTPTATVPPATTTPQTPALGLLTVIVSGDPDTIAPFDTLLVNLSAARIFAPAANGTIYTEVPLREQVDLINTTLTANRSVDVLDLPLATGRYSRIEIDLSRIAATVNGTAVNVTVPDNRLAIDTDLAIRENQVTTFVFTIGAEKAGTGYRLIPVTPQSG